VVHYLHLSPVLNPIAKLPSSQKPIQQLHPLPYSQFRLTDGQINGSICVSLYCPLPLLHPSPFSPPQSPSSPPRWVVLADYQATESGMLTVYEGELVEVIDISRNEWCLVRPIARGAAEGWVPATYLKPYDAGGYSKSVYSRAQNKHTCIFGVMYTENWADSSCIGPENTSSLCHVMSALRLNVVLQHPRRATHRSLSL